MLILVVYGVMIPLHSDRRLWDEHGRNDDRSSALLVHV